MSSCGDVYYITVSLLGDLYLRLQLGNDPAKCWIEVFCFIDATKGFCHLCKHGITFDNGHLCLYYIPRSPRDDLGIYAYGRDRFFELNGAGSLIQG